MFRAELRSFGSETSERFFRLAKLFLGVNTHVALSKLGSRTKQLELKAIVDKSLARIGRFKETGSWTEGCQESDFDSGGEDQSTAEESYEEEAPNEEISE